MVPLMFNLVQSKNRMKLLQLRNTFVVSSIGFLDIIALMFSYLSVQPTKPPLKTKLQPTCSNTAELMTLCLSSLQTLEEKKNKNKKRSHIESWSGD